MSRVAATDRATDPAGHAGWFDGHEERLRARLTDHLDRLVLPHVAQWSSDGSASVSAVLAGLGERGWLGMGRHVSEGGGHGAWSRVVLAECLGALLCERLGSAVCAHDVAVDMLSVGPAGAGGYLRPALHGQTVLSYAMADQDGGLRALPGRGGYRLDGTGWAPAVADAGAFVVPARLAVPGPSTEVVLVVPAGAAGVRRGPASAAGSGELWLSNVFVPDRDAALMVGAGVALDTQDRVVSAARLVAAVDRVLARTLEHTRDRRTFAVTLADHQAVRFRLADLRASLDGTRALVYAAADRWALGEDGGMRPDAALLRASVLARTAARTCLHLFGATGQVVGHPVGRAFLDAWAIGFDLERRARTGLVRHLERTDDG